MKNPSATKDFSNNRYQSPEEQNKFNVDAIWDSNALKYWVACGTLHVTNAAKYICYTQLFMIGVFSASLLYIYATTVTMGASDDNSVNNYMAKYMSALLSAITIQLGLILMMLHGIRNGKRSLLMPYIGFAAIALFLAVFQISMDFIMFIDSRAFRNGENPASSILIHFMGVLVHVWCMKVFCKCYSYFGDKNVAESIGQQLRSTSMAFAVDFTRPPPYSRLPTDIQPLTQA